MSAKLLKLSLDIIEGDIASSKSNAKGKLSNGSSDKKSALNKKISRDRHCGQPQKRGIQDVQKEMATKGSKSEENIKRLLALSLNTVKVKDAAKIIQRAHKGRYVNKILPKVEQESIFTEEDFQKFEEEYFNS